MKFLIFLFSVLCVCIAFSQTGIRGDTQDATGEPLPFATVYIKGTTNGTISNASGAFFIKAEDGAYTVVVQHVGYQTVEQKVTVSEGETSFLSFSLKEQAMQLETVVVTAENENPAYRVIRQAMKKRKYFEKEVQAFQCNVYLKGSFRLDKRPEQILGQKVTIDTGIVYLSESVSTFAFERPDKVAERMISSKVSGNEQGFSFNQASDFNINVYEKSYTNEVLGERSFVSPIANQAFLFYDYEWLGLFQENGQAVNKIRLLPKRATDPAFEGEIYIVEDTWRIYAADFLATKARGIDFTDSLKISQVFAPVQDSIWMPLSQNFSFQFGAFGFKGSGYYVGVYSDYEVEPNYAAMQNSEGSGGLARSASRIDLFEKEDFSAEVLRVDEGSNERDTTYWKTIRPIPLTQTERQDYAVKDSIRLVKESKPYKDSVDREVSKLTVGKVLLSGYYHANSVKEKYWSLPPIISVLQFNTVEGFVPEVQPTIWFQEDERTRYWIKPAIRYGFSSERLYAKLEGSYRRLDDRFTRLYGGGGKYITQYDETEAISPFINSWVTLTQGRNYMKLLEKSFAYLKFQQEVRNGVLFTGGMEYADRSTLENTNTDYYWTQSSKVDFTSNVPVSEELVDPDFGESRAFIADATFRIRFKQTYATRPDGKIRYPSGYPELHFTYKKGTPVLGSDVDFDFLQLKVVDEVSFGLVGKSEFQIVGGTFLNDQSLTFVDFKHFTGNQTSLSQLEKEAKFELLPFYEFSTAKSFFELHYEHHFNEFIFNKIPLVKKLNLQAVASLNYLNTPTIGDYVELGAGIEHIFKIMRVDYWWSFRNGSYITNGWRLGIGF